MKRILVTGGAGFIGCNFVGYLLKKYKGYKIIVLDALTYAGSINNFSDEIKNNKNFVFWQGNVMNGEIVNELVQESDVVVHMAAESHVARSIYDNRVFFETDVIGTQVVANAVAHNKVERFIHISSSEVYGTAETDPMTEDHPLNPMSPYAAAKVGADRLVYSYFKTYDIPAVMIRPFNNYGPYQHLEKVIPRFITSALTDRPLTVHGEGRSSRDWLNVNDHCRALDAFIHCDIEKVKGEVFNIGTGRDISVGEIAEMVLDILGKPKSLITHVEDRQGQVTRHISSVDKVRDKLGYRPEVEFEKGLEDTIRWYSDNRDWWERLVWMKSIPMRLVGGEKVIY